MHLVLSLNVVMFLRQGEFCKSPGRLVEPNRDQRATPPETGCLRGDQSVFRILQGHIVVIKYCHPHKCGLVGLSVSENIDQRVFAHLG
jgi:hypothetical protein